MLSEPERDQERGIRSELVQMCGAAVARGRCLSWRSAKLAAHGPLEKPATEQKVGKTVVVLEFFSFCNKCLNFGPLSDLLTSL